MFCHSHTGIEAPSRALTIAYLATVIAKLTVDTFTAPVLKLELPGSVSLPTGRALVVRYRMRVLTLEVTVRLQWTLLSLEVVAEKASQPSLPRVGSTRRVKAATDGSMRTERGPP